MPGGHLRVTAEDTIPSPTTRPALRRPHDRGDPGQTEAAPPPARLSRGARVAILRANHAIPVYQPPLQPDVGPLDDDVVVVTITEAEKILGVSKVALYRWI